MCNVNIEQYIRIIDAYRRTFACLFAEIIHNSILHLIRYKLGMTEFLAEYNCIYRKRLVYIKILFPWNSLYLVVNFISILCRKILDRFQNADSSTEAEICLVHHTLVSCK